MKSLIFVCYGEPVPSSRYRAYQYYQKLNKPGTFKVGYFSINPKNVKSYSKLLLIPVLLLRKVYSLIKIMPYEVVFLQKFPIKFLSPYYEWIIRHVLRKKLVFDFDDSIWTLTGKYDSRVQKIISLSSLVIVGNKFLKRFADNFNKNVIIINTVIDTKLFRKVKKVNHSTINICWIGTKPNNDFLVSLEQVFMHLKDKYEKKIKFFFVSNERPPFKLFQKYKYFDWSKNIENKILHMSDIGIMPLDNTDIAKGKCGFKIILYGAYSLASVASPVGINKEIVIDGYNGYLAKNSKEWEARLSELIDNKNILRKMRKNARDNVVKNYSIESKIDYFISSINNII